MKQNNELEPFEEAGLLLVFMGLDLMVNRGKITSRILNSLNQVKTANEIK